MLKFILHYNAEETQCRQSVEEFFWGNYSTGNSNKIRSAAYYDFLSVTHILAASQSICIISLSQHSVNINLDTEIKTLYLYILIDLAFYTHMYSCIPIYPCIHTSVYACTCKYAHIHALI